MKYVKMLGLLAVAAAALMAFAGIASATTITSPEGTEYNGTIEATSTNGKLTGSFVAVECTHSVAKGKVETNNTEKEGKTVAAGGKVSSLSFTGCNYPTSVGKEGTLTINSSNQVVSSGAEVEIETSVGTCVFTTNNTTVGTLSEGSPAVMNINSAKIARTAGSFLCGSSGTWTGSYTVTSPSSLYVD